MSEQKSAPHVQNVNLIDCLKTIDATKIIIPNKYKPEIIQFNKFKQTKLSHLYAFTVKINGIRVKDYQTIDAKSYQPFFNILYQLSEVITYCGEVDNKGLLHYHGVIRIKTNFYRKNLRVKGYHLYIKRIYRLRYWVDYCFKNNVLYDFDNIKKCLV